ncbi:hypothetical protein J5226_05915 [Lysobacter sp. K5869]|uniref:hypothetical protein n=1 Tax=Lysobacter sp. K5869 TaxID=2820808 RepID=UPI001C0603D7|nr:hypothetical protein [Lysobacter sp. K5869]QWP77940.1 hypothetical protein J5226_05915 [Lysobacter sp. K5869]
MKRPSRPSAPRWPAVLALAAACAASPAAGAQVVDQRYDPANVNNRIDNPVFQRQMTRSAQAIAENLVGRPANATDQRILGQFNQLQTQALHQMQNAMDRMPSQGAGAAYGNAQPQLDARSIQQLQQSPEGRYVLEQLAAEQNRARAAGASQAQPQYQQQYQQAPRAPQSEYDRLYQQAYGQAPAQTPPPQYQSGYPQQAYGAQGGYAPPQSSVGRSLGGALLQDITNAAIQRSIGPRVQVQGNTYYYQQPPRKP